MGRPKKNLEGPTALERVEEAFWSEFEQKSYSKITVANVVRIAGINRSAFYYHFDDINDLARYAVKDILIEDGPRMIFEVLRTNGAFLTEIINDPERSVAFKRLRLIASDHSSPELKDMLKHAIISVWLTTFDVDEKDLPIEAHTALRFVIGGLLEVVGNWGDDQLDVAFEALLKSKIAPTMAPYLAQTLLPYAKNTTGLDAIIQVSNRL